MNELIRILMEIDDTIDWEEEQYLIDDRILDSFAVISLITELEEYYDIEIEASEINPGNLNSVQSIWNMVQKLKGR